MLIDILYSVSPLVIYHSCVIIKKTSADQYLYPLHSYTHKTHGGFKEDRWGQKHTDIIVLYNWFHLQFELLPLFAWVAEIHFILLICPCWTRTQHFKNCVGLRLVYFKIVVANWNSVKESKCSHWYLSLQKKLYDRSLNSKRMDCQVRSLQYANSV